MKNGPKFPGMKGKTAKITRGVLEVYKIRITSLESNALSSLFYEHFDKRMNIFIIKNNYNYTKK